jgi:hemolysin D
MSRLQLRARPPTRSERRANAVIVRPSARSRAVGTAVSAFESETLAVFERTAPASEHLILYVLLAMVALAIGLISVTKLDRVVTGIGRVVPVGGSLYVQPFQESIVREILVKAGDIVKKGQPLATLDPTFTSADLVQLQQHVQSDEAVVAREQAEHDDRPYVPSSSGSYEALQFAIWQQRQAEYKSSVGNFDAQIKNSEATIAQYKRDIVEYGKRLKVAADLEGINTTLEKSGWGSRMKTLMATDSRVEIGRLMADAESQLVATQATADSLAQQRKAYIEKWHSDTGTDLVTNRNDLDKSHDDLTKAQKLSQLVSLDAPQDAIVLKIGRISKSSVVGPPTDQTTEPLFTLTPLDKPLEADLDIDAQNVGFVRPGDKVEVKFDAYRFLEHGTAKGIVKTVSEGSFTTDEDSAIPHQSSGSTEPVTPFFKVRVAFTDLHLKNVPADFRLTPGNTLTADIIVGRRTILSYIVEGALRTGSEAMREP